MVYILESESDDIPSYYIQASNMKEVEAFMVKHEDDNWDQLFFCSDEIPDKDFKAYADKAFWVTKPKLYKASDPFNPLNYPDVFPDAEPEARQ